MGLRMSRLGVRHLAVGRQAVPAQPPSARTRFFVVGNPRSGTTLVQRLACEIPGVRMPPETHFFSNFVLSLLGRRRFPLDTPALRQELHRFANRPRFPGLDVDVEAVVEDLGGTCARPFDLFDAVVRQLAGPAAVWGEKTPWHLLWWKAIHRAAPWVRFVVVVRDPRSVVASGLTMPWNESAWMKAWGDAVHVALAEEWRRFQHVAGHLQRSLGPERCLVLRYEDVVADPDAARRRIARLIGLTRGGELPGPDLHRSDLDGPELHGPELQSVPSPIVLDSEWWKGDALGPVADDRVASWRRTLDERQARQVSVVCRASMRRQGYRKAAPSVATSATGWREIGSDVTTRIMRTRLDNWRTQRRIDRTPL
jgi:Sulfotransferase family